MADLGNILAAHKNAGVLPLRARADFGYVAAIYSKISQWSKIAAILRSLLVMVPLGFLSFMTLSEISFSHSTRHTMFM